MQQFTKGLALCESFFKECAQPIIDEHFPNLKYTAGLLGYGSDVLGYDDAISTDHMWGPRFYLFLSDEDMRLERALMDAFSLELPHQHAGHSVNFSAPDGESIRVPEPISGGRVSPLIWIMTIDDFIKSYLGLYPKDNLEWLSMSEHRLLGFISGKLFRDDLGLVGVRNALRYYPNDVKLYLLASQWALIAEEQAFVGRMLGRGDALGANLVGARIAERLMRLCFLYGDTYAPYSKWFSKGFELLAVDGEIEAAIRAAACGNSAEAIARAQALIADMHNASGITPPFEVRIQNYFNREIPVIFAGRLADMIREKITDERLKNFPLIGSLSQIGNFVTLADDPKYLPNVLSLYNPASTSF